MTDNDQEGPGPIRAETALLSPVDKALADQLAKDAVRSQRLDDLARNSSPWGLPFQVSMGPCLPWARTPGIASRGPGRAVSDPGLSAGFLAWSLLKCPLPRLQGLNPRWISQGKTGFLPNPGRRKHRLVNLGHALPAFGAGPC